MNTLIEKLYVIEEDANSVRAQADAKKKKLTQQMEQQKSDYDKALQQTTADTIAKLQAELNQQIQSALEAQERATQATLSQLEKNYAQNHSTLAQSILESLLVD